MGGGNRARLVELVGVERDRLLAEHVLARRKGLAQVGDVRVVRCGEIDGVDVRARDEVVDGVIDPAHAILLGKGVGLVPRAICHAVDGASLERQRLRHLVGDDATTDDTPAKPWGGFRGSYL